MGMVGLLALWVGKLAIGVAHRFGWGGSTLPGRLARGLDRQILRRLSGQLPLGSLVVTGTNGKTTTASLIASIMKAGGREVVHNRAGANLIGGVTAAFLAGMTWRGRARGNVAVMEVDEATMPRTVEEIRPRVAVVTNFFRDQLDRYGELETTVNLVRQGLARLPEQAAVSLNADDPHCVALAATAQVPEVAVAQYGPVATAAAGAGNGTQRPAGGSDEGGLGQRRVVFFGIEDDMATTGELDEAADAKHCLRCGHPFRYEVAFYAHLGKYLCPSCGFARPRPHVFAKRISEMDAGGSTVQVATPLGEFTCRLRLPGLYNVYNALAATAAAVAVGLPLETIRQGLEQATSSFGRMERIPMAGRDAFLALVKNPAGFNAVLRTVLVTRESKNLLFALNDLYADGTDISWIWDVDFESLAGAADQVQFAVCSGERAEDMALRLKYAGVDTTRIVVERDLAKALDQSLEFMRPGDLLYILPTYTAMLRMRSILQRRGYTGQFWEA